MALFTSTKFNSLDELFIDQLQDVYDAEQRLAKVLPKLAESAQNPSLKDALRAHNTETDQQVHRIEEMFGKVNEKPKSKTCDAMKGLINEAESMAEADGDPDVRDAAIIAAAQRIDHYEIAAYGTARNFAERLGHSEVANELQQCLDEEKAADARLSKLAEESINAQAASVS